MQSLLRVALLNPRHFLIATELLRKQKDAVPPPLALRHPRYYGKGGSWTTKKAGGQKGKREIREFYFQVAELESGSLTVEGKKNCQSREINPTK